MRHTVMQLRAHEDGVTILAMLAEELHIAKAIPHGYFEDFAANKSFSDLAMARVCHVALGRVEFQQWCGPVPTL